jgi:thioredoxin-like negative regulator of GroEL
MFSREFCIIAIIVLLIIVINRPSSKVVSESFTSVKRGGKLILYYAPWCPHCTHFKPEWNIIESDSELKNIGVECEAIDCDAKKEKCGNVRGFPTIMLYKSNGQEVEYNGARKKEDVKKFVKENL